MSLVRDIVDRVFFPHRDVHSIPVLDAGFSPNEKLDLARQIGGQVQAPDALTVDAHGTLFVSTGKNVLACTGRDFEVRKPLISFDANAGALAWSEKTGLLVCVSGSGVCSLDHTGKVKGWLKAIDR